MRRIFLVLRFLCEQSELKAAFGNEFVQLILGLCEVTHLPLQFLAAGDHSRIDPIATAGENTKSKPKESG